MDFKSIFSGHKLSLRPKLILPLIAVIVVSSLVLYQFEKGNVRRDISRLSSALVTPMMQSHQKERIVEDAVEFVSKLEVQSDVLAVDVWYGNPLEVIASSRTEEIAITRSNHLEYESLQQQTLIGIDGGVGKFVSPLNIEDERAGLVYLEVDAKNSIRSIKTLITVFILLWVMGAVIAYILLSVVLLRPIKDIYGLIDLNEDGESPERLNNTQMDELGRLSRRVDKMFNRIGGMNRELRSILDALPAMIFYRSKDNRILRLNKLAADSLGKSAEEIEGRFAKEFFPEKDADVYFEDDKVVVESGVPRLGTIEHYETSEGLVRVTKTDKIPLIDSTGNCNGVLVVAKDVTVDVERENALKERNFELRVALSTVDSLKNAIDEHALVSITNIKGSITFVNEKFCKVSQYSKSELNGKDHRIINSARHSKKFWKELWKTIASGQVWHGEICNHSKDGSEYWVDTTIVPLFDTENKINQYISIRTEITELKRIEKSLRRTSNLLEKTSEVSEIGGWELDMLSNHLDWSLMTKRIHGVDEDYEPNLDSALEFYKEGESRDSISAAVGRAIEMGEAWDITLQLVRQSGEEIWVRAIGETEFVEGSCVRVFGTFQNVDEQTKAKEKLENYSESLKETSDRLALAARAGGVGIWEWDVVENVLKWDAQMFKLYGIQHENMFDGAYEVWTNGIHPDDRELADAEVLAALEGRGEFNTQFRVVLNDGRIRHLRAMAIVERDDAGKAVSMVGTNWDITDAVKRERELSDLADKAKMASEAKSEFLANMSHEIRTPMNGVIGMTGLLLDTTELTDEQRHFAETVRVSGESLLALINDILDFSKVESGKLELEIVSFDLLDVLDEFSSVLALRAEEQGLEFVCSAAPDVPRYLKGDSGRLRQVLLNLTGNALKFTSEGQVVVRATVSDEDEQSVEVLFSVEDTGIGISEDAQEALFEKFTQADASTTRRYGGTGLGLAISKQLTLWMGGRIWMESALGGGSTFWFTAKFEKQTEIDNISEGEDELRGIRTLVVDDNLANREILYGQLTHWGMEVSDCDNGAEALDVLEKNAIDGSPYEIAILDMQMPEMDGLELARRIKSTDVLKGTKLILLTSIEDFSSMAKDVSDPFEAKMTKPVRLSQLHRYLSEIANLSSGEHRVDVTSNGVRVSNARILLAEDNIVNQMVAQGMLKSEGYRVDVVANGQEALRALEDLPYDLVLMDIQMPEMDGLVATRLIRGSSSRVLDRGIPIIAMTAHAREEDREACLHAGMDDYLTKPISPEDLFSTVAKWLGHSRENQVVEEVMDQTMIFDYKDFLGRVLNDMELGRKIAHACIEDVKSKGAEMQMAFDGKDTQQMELLAHSIKGALANLGGRLLADSAAKLERLIRTDELDGLGEAHQEFQFQCKAFQYEVSNFFSNVENDSKKRF